MIKSAHIFNFQSHKESHLEFHPGVNVIVGQSDSGKTAVLRAILWLITNRPSGDSFRSTFGGDTRVSVGLEDSGIWRVKTGKENRYAIGTDETGTLNEFKAMGSEVPEEVIRALNISELNIQRQLDAPFLLSMSSGQVAQYLNEVVRLDVIDKAISNINSKMKKLSSNLADEQARLRESEEQHKALDYVQDMDKAVTRLEALAASGTRIRNEEAELNRLTLEIEDIEDKIKKYSYLNKANQKLTALLSLNSHADELWIRADEIEQTLKQIEETEKGISFYEKTTRAARLYKHISALVTQLSYIKQEASNINIELEEITKTESKLIAVEITLDNLHKWWDKNAPDICPLCEGQGRLKK